MECISGLLTASRTVTATLTATSFHTGVITSLAMKLLRGREGMTSPKAAEPANAPTPDGPCPSRRSPGRLLPPPLSGPVALSPFLCCFLPRVSSLPWEPVACQRREGRCVS